MRQQTPGAQFNDAATIATPEGVQRSVRGLQRAINDQLAEIDRTTVVNECHITVRPATTAAGGLFAWQNRTGSDLLIVGFVLDVRAASVVFNMDFGTAVNATTAATNIFNATVMGGTGVYTSTVNTLVQICPIDYFITGSSNGGAAVGTFSGECYIQYLIRQPQ